MFDNEIVRLGTAVNAQNNNSAEVLTIVDNLSATKTMGYSEVVTEITNQTDITEAVGRR